MKLTDDLLNELKNRIKKKEFSNLKLRDAIEYIQSGGFIPNADISLDTWFRFSDFLNEWELQRETSFKVYSATELKNKTGEILTAVLRGHQIAIQRHGHIVAVISSPELARKKLKKQSNQI